MKSKIQIPNSKIFLCSLYPTCVERSRSMPYAQCPMLFTLCSMLHALCSFGQAEPISPNTSSVITCFPDTSDYALITVGPIDRDYQDLQAAINAASLGTVILLDAGEIFYGGFQLPDKGAGEDWIIIMSSRMDLLPGAESRIHPTANTGDNNFPLQQDAMPKIITNNLSGIPVFKDRKSVV